MKQLDREKFLARFENLGFNVDTILSMNPGAWYVGQFPLRTVFAGSGDTFTDFAVDVFYNPSPDVSKGHSNYFAYFSSGGKVYVTNAGHVEDLLLVVYTDKNGNYIYSRYQHDFRGFDGNYIDGGWWSKQSNGKFMMNGRLSWVSRDIPIGAIVCVKDGEFYELETKMIGV